MTSQSVAKVRAWFEIAAIAMGVLSPFVAVGTTLAVDKAINGERISNLIANDVKHDLKFELIITLIEKKFDQLDDRMRSVEKGLARVEGKQ